MLEAGMLAVALALGLAPPADASFGADAAARVDVHWQSSPGCDGARFEAGLQALLTTSDASVRVDAVASQNDAQWSLQARFDAGARGAGSRRFEAATCDTVVDAAVLAIAIAVEPSVVERFDAPADVAEPEPDTVEPPPTLTVPAPRPEVVVPPPEAVLEPRGDAGPPPTAPPSADRRALTPSLGLLGFVDGLALPGAGGGLSGVGALRIGAFRAELQGSYRFATVTKARADPAVQAAFSSWSVAGHGLWNPVVGPIELAVGAGLEAGQVIGAASGFEGSQTAFEPWIAPSASAGVLWPLGRRWAVLARGQAAVPVFRPRFVVENLESIHRLGAVRIRGLLGLEFRFS